MTTISFFFAFSDSWVREFIIAFLVALLLISVSMFFFFFLFLPKAVFIYLTSLTDAIGFILLVAGYSPTATISASLLCESKFVVINTENSNRKYFISGNSGCYDLVISCLIKEEK